MEGGKMEGEGKERGEMRGANEGRGRHWTVLRVLQNTSEQSLVLLTNSPSLESGATVPITTSSIQFIQPLFLSNECFTHPNNTPLQEQTYS
jgi:hypothetical protein